MKKSILVIYGESQYGVLTKATDIIISGFNKRGYDVETLRLDDDDQLQYVGDYLAKEYEFIFSLQAILFNINNVEGVPLISLVDTPWIGWIVDDYLYHLTRVMNNQYDYSHLFFVDNRMKEYVQLMFPEMNNITTLFHGGFENQNHDVEKDIDILFPGSGGVYKKFEDSVDDPMPVEVFLVQESIRVLEENPKIAVRTALKQVLNQIGEDLDTQLISELTRVIFYVDGYIRRSCRTKILDTLLKAGFNIHILGNGYADIENQYPDQVTCYGAVEIEEVVELMARSKIVMNALPPVFEEGFHERIFSSMLCKAVCFTPDFDFARQQLGERLEYINMNNMEQMVDDIHRVLDNFEQQQERLEDNYQYALANHTWEKRGEEIIDFYESKVMKMLNK